MKVACKNWKFNLINSLIDFWKSQATVTPELWKVSECTCFLRARPLYAENQSKFLAISIPLIKTCREKIKTICATLITICAPFAISHCDKEARNSSHLLLWLIWPNSLFPPCNYTPTTVYSTDNVQHKSNTTVRTVLPKKILRLDIPWEIRPRLFGST